MPELCVRTNAEPVPEAVTPVVPEAALISSRKAVKSLTDEIVAEIALVASPPSVNSIVPAWLKFPKETFVRAVASTPVEAVALLIDAAIVSAVALAETLTVDEPLKPATVAVCAVMPLSVPTVVPLTMAADPSVLVPVVLIAARE